MSNREFLEVNDVRYASKPLESFNCSMDVDSWCLVVLTHKIQVSRLFVLTCADSMPSHVNWKHGNMDALILFHNPSGLTDSSPTFTFHSRV